MRARFLHRISLVTALALISCAASPAVAEEFYKGKLIRFVVGAPPGGGYDTYSRAIARHIGKYIPGNPTTIVQNMPGAGTLMAANYIYNRGKADGLTIGVWSSAFVLLQSLGDRGVRIDGQKVGWIGAPSKGTPVCAIMGFTGLKTLKDVIETKKPIRLGATRAGSPYYDVPTILNRTLGTKFDVISGYRGTSLIRLAMQKREVDGACWTWESMRVSARALLKAKGGDKLIPYLIHKRWNDPEVKNLPLIPNEIEARAGKDALATYLAWASSGEFMRPFTLPPGAPKERLSILRKAFQATLEDPQFLAEAKKSKLAIEFVPGEKIEQLVKGTLAMPGKTKESLQFLVRKKKRK